MKNKLHYITCLICLLSISCAVSAQLLYKISGKGLTEPSYIFATHHAVPLHSIENVDNVFRCYNQCSAVVGEIVLNEDSTALLMAREAQMATSIRNLLSDSDYRMVDSALKVVVGISLSDVAYLRPAIIENIYILSLYEKIFPKGEDDSSMDSFFQNIAIQQGKSVYGLETAQGQIDILFHSQSVNRQALQLVKTISQSVSLNEEVNHLNELYLTAQLDSIAQWTIDSEGLNPDEYSVLVTNRNKKWINLVEDYINQQSCFIAVGAMHLPTKEGLLHLLAKRGYKITPMDK